MMLSPGDETLVEAYHSKYTQTFYERGPDFASQFASQGVPDLGRVAFAMDNSTLKSSIGSGADCVAGGGETT